MCTSNRIKLVERAVAGDRVALKTLLASSRELLRTRVERRIPPMLRSVVDADDIVQETHAEVFQRIGDFRPQGPDGFDRWIAVIALNRLRNEIRRWRATRRGGGAGAAANAHLDAQQSTVMLLSLLSSPEKRPSQVVAREDAHCAVSDALEALPLRQQQAVRLVYVEGQTATAAAQAIGCTERAVHGLCRRGLRALEQQLGDAAKFLTWIG